MYIIGIDPGTTGAVAIIDATGGIPELIDTPTAEVVRNKKKKNDYMPSEMARILMPYSTDSAESSAHVYIEQVSAMPGNGATSMFGFGKGFGIWLGILAAYAIPYTLVTPQAWKKIMMAGMSSEKDAARVRAIQLYPELSDQLRRKKDIGRADALLIAAYGMKLS